MIDLRGEIVFAFLLMQKFSDGGVTSEDVYGVSYRGECVSGFCSLLSLLCLCLFIITTGTRTSCTQSLDV